MSWSTRLLGEKLNQLQPLFDPGQYFSDPGKCAEIKNRLRRKDFVAALLDMNESGWYKIMSGSRAISEERLKFIADYFHLSHLLGPGASPSLPELHGVADESGWRLLTDDVPLDVFGYLIVSTGYGYMKGAAERTKAAIPGLASRYDYLTPLLPLGMEREGLTLRKASRAAERGAMEEVEERAEEFHARINGGSYYWYETSVEPPGYLTLIEIAESDATKQAGAHLLVPSRRMDDPYVSGLVAMPSKQGEGTSQFFRMDFTRGLCDAIAIISNESLQKTLPRPDTTKYFAKLSVGDIQQLADELERKPVLRRAIRWVTTRVV